MNKILLLLLSLAAGRLTAQCIALNNCPTTPVKLCDNEPNLPVFWNESYWLAPDGQHDLLETQAEFRLEVTICPGVIPDFRYLLFLDLDYDGLQETVVDSDAPPGYNTVNFGNAANPGYTGGTPRAFDERPVAANQKYGFTIQTAAQGMYAAAYVRWHTQSAPNTYSDPKLPVGHHKIRWLVTNAQGEQKTCEYTFTTKKDCFPPTVVCKNNLSINILPGGSATVFDTDFLLYMEDNVTPPNLLVNAIRKVGAGAGFPVDAAGQPIHNISYDCSELGLQEIELWAMDEDGNSDFCQTYLFVQDNLEVCDAVGTTQPGNDSALQCSVAPNPFSGSLQISVRCGEATALSARLLDQTGREIFRRDEAVPAGARLIELPNTAALPPGFYVLYVEDASGTRRVEKVLKQ